MATEKSQAQIWWDALSSDVQDAVNHSLFNKRVLDIDEAYKIFGKIIK
jgi:hypothetical protein